MIPPTLRFLPVDWPNATQLCMAFRRDAWLVSYGSIDGFSELETAAWFELLARLHPSSFLHVWLAGQVIGQIEYRSPITWEDNTVGGYVNLFYLLPSHRGQGLGQMMHDCVIHDLRLKEVRSVRLRVIVGNTIALRFYAKQGWQMVGEADAKGAQLMSLALY
jgi:ribosomal protein S18 acetylase RimI-like enzyme